MIDMTVVRVKGFQIFEDRSGRMRCYHRKTRASIDLVAAPLGSAAFFAECERITRSHVAKEPQAGTLDAVIAKYRADAKFLDLAEQTRADYQKIFDYLAKIGDTRLALINRPFVVLLRDKAAGSKGRRFGNYVKAVISIVFGWGAERGYVKENPATGIKDIRRKKGTPEANRPWSDAERHAVLDGMPAHMRPALALMMLTGLGPKDALTLPRTFYKNGDIATSRAKTGEPVFWPAPLELTAALEQAPQHSAITLCANSVGVPWTMSGYRASWRTVRVRLEAEGAVQPGLTLYGLRHTVAVILREIGYDERTIADALGQKTIEMARHYAKGADLRPKMRGVVTSLNAELAKRRTGSVKPKE